MNGALSRIPWLVRYLARGTIDRLKTRGVSPELCPKLQVKRLCVPVFRQRLVRKMFWYVYCVAVAIFESHETFVGYFTSTSRLHHAYTHYAAITIVHITCVPKTQKVK